MSETSGCLDPGRHPPYPPGQEGLMDPNVKKTTLRMIPYGLYVLTAAHADGRVSAGAVEMGDPSISVGKVVEAGLAKPIDGRADDATLWLKELGDKVFYGG